MKPTAKPAKVILRRCDDYDVETIRKIVREAMEELDLRPTGRTLLKPNLVASGPMFQHAFTRPEVTEGVLLALRDRDQGKMTELAVGERCGITVPTRMAMEGAGYDPMLKRLGVKRYAFEEEPQVEIKLTHKERLRDYIFTPEPIAKADFFVNVPKFKAHPWTTVTFSVKAYIGIQDDRHRLIDHDHRLNEKIADLQYIIQPELIVIDAITAGEGRMLTPIPFPMKMIIIGNNQVAFDTVCCNIIGVDPMTVDHIRLAHERGFGPTDLSQIEVTGDISLADAKKRADGFKVGLIRVEKYFEGTHLSAYSGPPPESEQTDYCWGGCPGALEEAIEILRLFDAQTDTKLPYMHIVFGAYAGPIPAKPGEKIIFMGDCATFHGKAGDTVIDVSSLYRDRSTKDPYTVKHEDVFKKMWKTIMLVRENKDQQVIRIEGCPVSVSEQVLLLVSLGGLKSPYLEGENMLAFNKAYLQWKSAAAWSRMKGVPYQRHGHCDRGHAAPDVTAPAEGGE